MDIVVFGAHPDDMEIGMGGTIAKYTQAGHNVYMVLAEIPNNKEQRLSEAKKASRILGANFLFLDMNPDDLVYSRKIVRNFDAIITKYSPDVVYTHWNHDSHQDHVIVTESVIAATRKNNCSLYMYEQTIPGGIVPYGFRMQSLIDISDVIDLKLNSILAHKSQVDSNGDWWLYGIEGRAMYRGYQINVKFAEAFEVIKEVKSI
ncbi:PIG-L deacetylase family protein [Methanothrix soehngenii]